MTNRIAHNLIARALERGGRGHRAARIWLSAIGVDPRDFGEQIPAILAFHPECPWQTIDRETITAPAIVMAVTNPAGTVVGILRRWLPHDWDSATPDDFLKPNPVDPWLMGDEPGMVRIQGRPGGPIVLTRTVETALAVAAASPGTHAWAAARQGEHGWPEAVKRSVQLMVAAGKQAERLTLLLGDDDAVPAGLEAACAPVPLVVRRPEHAKAKVAELAVDGKVELADLVRHGGSKMMRAVLGDLGGGFAQVHKESAAGDSWGPGGWSAGMAPWGADTRGESPEQLAPPTPLERARRFLYEECRARGQRRFTLARWLGKWWLWNGAGKYDELTDERLRSMMWHWLDRFLVMKRGKAERLAPSQRHVAEVMSALAGDTAVVSQVAPCWMPDVIDADGAPLWGRAVNLKAEAARSATISYRNGLLDLDEVVQSGRVRLSAHSASLFATSDLPFDLDGGLLERLLVLEPESDEYEAIFEAIAPKWRYWLHSASELDKNPPGWRRQLQLMMGDTISGDRTMEKVFMVVGLQRSGKGIIEDALAAIMGEENVAAPTLDSFTDKFGMAPLLGKSVIVVPDANLSNFTEGGGVVAALKTISGNGRVSIRDLYAPAYTAKLQGRVWIFANREPDLRDQSGAMADRFIVLPMMRSTIGKEDPSIKASVPAEAHGIMLWALLGAIALARMERRAIAISESGRVWHQEIKDRSAAVPQFVADCLELSPQYRCSRDDVVTAWNVWCHEEMGAKSTGIQRFLGDLRVAIPGMEVSKQETMTGQRARRCTGFRLNPEWRTRVEAKGPKTYGNDDTATWLRSDTTMPPV